MPNSEDCHFMTNHCAYKRTNEQKPENYQIIKFMEKQTDQNTNNEKPTSTKKITRTKYRGNNSEANSKAFFIVQQIFLNAKKIEIETIFFPIYWRL